MRWALAGSWLLNLRSRLTLIVDEFGTKLFEEIDYLNEGRNAKNLLSTSRASLVLKSQLFTGASQQPVSQP